MTNSTSTGAGTVARPFARMYWARSDAHRHLTWLAVAGLAAAVLMATFGLPPVNLHGPFHYLGVMDPLCGGTRAARLTAQGHLAAAWRYNPLGILAVLAASAAALRLLVGVTTGRWLDAEVVWTPRRTRWVVAAVLVTFVVLEIRQQGRADLLMRPY